MKTKIDPMVRRIILREAKHVAPERKVGFYRWMIRIVQAEAKGN